MHRHFIIHKPYGYLSQFVNNQSKRKSAKKLLGAFYDFPDGIMAIGRLDEDSEGLLFLTTDGVMSERVRSKKVEKDRHGPTSWVSITITEGKFGQVRKMTAAVGFPTLRLIRVRIGNVTLGSIPTGACKEVDSFDIG